MSHEGIFLKEEAPGYMINLIDRRAFFVQTDDWPGFKDGYLELKGNKAYELYFTPAPGNRINCSSELLRNTPPKTTWMKIPEHAIMMIQKVSENSFIWQSVVKCRSNIILANDFKANIKSRKK